MKFLEKHSMEYEKWKIEKSGKVKVVKPKKVKIPKPVKIVRPKAIGIPSQKFMKVVEKYPIIYDLNHPDYNNNNLTDKAWSEIASQFKLTGMPFLINFMFIYIDLFIYFC